MARFQRAKMSYLGGPMQKNDNDWWKERKALSLARKSASAVRPACAEVGDSILIVTEGEVTEPIYFELLMESLKLSTVTVKVIPGYASDPRYVIQTAVKEINKLKNRAKKNLLAVNEVKKYDHVWAVIDTDVATRGGFWNDVNQKANAAGVKLAHSTPCFEYWLLLHLRKTTRSDLMNGDAAKRAFKGELGKDYSTNREVAEEAIASILPNWPTAVKYAQEVRQGHETAGTKIPANPSTDVDLLTCAMNDSALPHNRKIKCKNSSREH